VNTIKIQHMNLFSGTSYISKNFGEESSRLSYLILGS